MFARLIVALFVICFLPELSFGQTNFPHENLLFEAKIEQCESEIAAMLEKDPENDHARLALGITRFVGSIETMGQTFYSWGLRPNNGLLPFIRMPVKDNPDYEDVTYELFRETFAQLKEDLAEVERTLEPIKADNIKLRSHPFEYRLDLNDDGEGQRSEMLKRIGARYFRGLSRMDTGPIVYFDKADVHWLRGYCHLLSAMCDFVLAYDQEPMWNVAARRVFRGAVVADDFLMEEEVGDNFWGMGLTDFIAAIHQSDLKLIDAEKMKSARNHLLATIEQSRIMWDEIEKETDNEGEWLPGVGQTSLFPGVTFTREMVKTWREFLDEGEKILNGEMLVPFWRGKEKTRGVNFKRFFTEPVDFDLVLWVHGSGAKPFLEEGEVSSPATWRRFQRVFRGDFIGFAMWVN